MPAMSTAWRCSSPVSASSRIDPQNRARKTTSLRLLLAAGLLILVGLRADASDSAGCEPLLWRQLSTEAAELQAAARIARARLDPRAIFQAETAYARLLEQAAGRLAASPPESLPAAPALVDLIERLLIARDPLVRAWLAEGWRDCGRLDSSGRLSFWAGLEAYDAQQWNDAVAYFSGRVAPWLRSYADWLRIAALAKMAPLAAAESALSLVRASPGHVFRDRLTAHALVGLLHAGQPERCERIVRRWIARRSPQGQWLSVAETLLAELARGAQNRDGCRRHFEKASGASRFAPGAEAWRLKQALWLLDAPTSLTSNQIADFLEVAARLGTGREAAAAWTGAAGGLAPADSLRAAGAILKALRGSRNHRARLQFCDRLPAQASAEIRQLADLERARMARRRGDLDALSVAYDRAAALGAGVTGEAATRSATALWELGREWEDAHDWDHAAATFTRLAATYPRHKKAWKARLRAALCWHRSGADSAAIAALKEMQRQAAPDRRAGPALWLALLSPEAHRNSLYETAALEQNPGYFALRAARAWGGGPAERTPCAAQSAGMALPTGDPFWQEIAAEIRDSSSWAWPRREPASEPLAARRLLQMIAGVPLVRSGEIFLAYGYRAWARDLWTSLPGWQACDETERGALLRALGDPAFAVRLSLASSERRARYPIAYADEVGRAAERFGFSAAFLLAVMRQESLLESTVRSPAGAYGLMQLMGPTARRMADSLGLGRSYDLARPADNLLLGTAHLDELWTATGGSLPVVLAAYNGGLENALRWIEPGMSWDDYIERIAYAETRGFVKSVLMHYWFYHCCYPATGRRDATPATSGKLAAQRPCPCD